MVRAVTLSNIGANYAAALSDCVCFAEAETRKGACLQAASRSGTCLSASQRFGQCANTSSGIDSLSEVRRRTVNYCRSAFGIYR
jgi:hypothetical protein